MSFASKLATLVCALVLLCVVPAVARAAVITLTVSNVNTQLAPAQIAAAEAAVTTEVNTLYRSYWHGPPIAFVPTGGIPVALYRGHSNLLAGIHVAGPTGPSAIVLTGTRKSRFALTGAGGRKLPWTVVLSHEVMELLVDPTGHRHYGNHLMETCDAVEASIYDVDGVPVSDFVTPRWFGMTTTGPYDYLGVTHHVRQVAPGGFMPGPA